MAAASAAVSMVRGAASASEIVASGVLLTIGIASRHFIGMAGVRIPGRLVLDEALVALALASGILLTCAAFAEVCALAVRQLLAGHVGQRNLSIVGGGLRMRELQWLDGPLRSIVVVRRRLQDAILIAAL